MRVERNPPGVQGRFEVPRGSPVNGSLRHAPGAHQAPRRGRPRCVAADVGEVFLPHQYYSARDTARESTISRSVTSGGACAFDPPCSRKRTMFADLAGL